VDNARESRVALLIDIENVSKEYLETIVNEANKFGKISIRRVYGDITHPSNKSWVDAMLEYSLTAIHQSKMTRTKNSSDFALVIDTMEILYSFDIDVFCIISKDSDFTRLVTKLKEHNKTVVGMGDSNSVSRALQKACDTYLFLDKVSAKQVTAQAAGDSSDFEDEKQSTAGSVTDSHNILDINELYRTLAQIIDESAYEDDWAFWSEAYNQLHKKHPEFDPRNYGFQGKALKFFEQSGRFSFRNVNKPIVSVRYTGD
jgi:uncharacterized protein (TIGR00288 family)